MTGNLADISISVLIALVLFGGFWLFSSQPVNRRENTKEPTNVEKTI